MTVAVSVGAAAAAFGLSLVVVAISGHSVGASISAMWNGAFGSEEAIGGTLSKMVPLLLVSLGWIVAFSTRRVNIGFEGQILAGGIVATVIGLNLGGLPTIVHLPLAVVGGVAGGAAWAGIAAWLWARRRVNEVISTLLLNFVAIQLVSWLVRGPLQEPTRSFDQTAVIKASARWPHLLGQTPLAWDFVLAVAMVGVTMLVIHRTTLGFRFRALGGNPEAARHAGISTNAVTVTALVISGGLAGLAGSSLILAGETGTMVDNFSANYGFDGIVVALLARNNPLACLPAALLFAFLRQGSGLMEALVGVPSSVVLITQGLVIIFITGAAFITGRRRAQRVDAKTASERLSRGALVSVPAHHPAVKES